MLKIETKQFENPGEMLELVEKTLKERVEVPTAVKQRFAGVRKRRYLKKSELMELFENSDRL
jgi:hypothetical protein